MRLEMNIIQNADSLSWSNKYTISGSGESQGSNTKLGKFTSQC